MRADTEGRGLTVLRPIDEILWIIDGETYLEQRRCVDWLLDIYNGCRCGGVREAIVTVLEGIRHVNLVSVRDFRRGLELICAAAAIEESFDHYDLAA